MDGLVFPLVFSFPCTFRYHHLSNPPSSLIHHSPNINYNMYNRKVSLLSNKLTAPPFFILSSSHLLLHGPIYTRSLIPNSRLSRVKYINVSSQIFMHQSLPLQQQQ
ncbi:hypothetical protein EYC84_008972 [Monilinia fructicola]|uniref:Uncharacterized protein n=1 Tax=Monilinia fructicola TaxID=38448 RepID=A0A5M9JAR1_MONFR|nr:hypothetical protein EYC84_008972 [Monilinia fructicola]